ncbi:serine/threonine-protein kinase [Biomphalaria glabrata]|nr:putative serine/threonine-protein kinase DD [Biomphalaria glabrata]
MNATLEPGSNSRKHAASPKLKDLFGLQRETDKRKKAEIELDNLHFKIDAMLSSMSSDSASRRVPLDEECVICFSAPAIMQTFPCGHKVVCRRCFVQTIQMAVCQRCLPLRCVVCRDHILRLNNTLPHHSPSTARVVTPTFFTPPLSKSSRLSIGPLLTINLLHKPWKPNNCSFRARHSPKSKPESKIPAVESTTRMSVTDSHKDSSDRDCDIETLVSSHSDTFTRNMKTRDLRQQTPDIKQKTPDIKQKTPNIKQKTPDIKQKTPNIKQQTTDFRCRMKSNDDKTLDHDVLRGGQHCKIHPESSQPVYSFLESNQAVGGPTSLSGATPKLNKATQFFSKFWPRSSRHKQTSALKKD